MTEPLNPKVGVIVLPQVDPGYWMGGPPGENIRFSVVLRKGVYEIWDLFCKDARRFDKVVSKDKALKRVSSWAKCPVILGDLPDRTDGA